MNMKLILIGIAIIVVSIIIYLIKNINEIKLKNITQKKIVKFIFYSLIIIACIFIGIYIYTSVKAMQNGISLYKEIKLADIAFKEFDEKIEKEDEFYNDIIKKDYGAAKKEPYILEGFEYVEGDIDTGYVIQDENGNQYVWVPCTNKEDKDIVKLEKKNFSLNTYINKHECADLEYEEFFLSALQNGGFYISRFEIGTEGGKLVSKQGAEVLCNISRTNAISSINNIYGNKINCKLINGYAYDTTLTWIEKNNNITIEKLNTKENEKIVCGRVKYNNIYDFTDNIMEVSLEDCYDTVVYRGFDYNEEISLNSRYNISENEMENFDNFLGIETMNKLAFRTVIYK